VGTFYCYQQEILEKEPLDALACGLGKHDGLSLSKHMRSGTPKKTSNNWERSPISLEGITHYHYIPPSVMMTLAATLKPPQMEAEVDVRSLK
jgi:hypothetical protein